MHVALLRDCARTIGVSDNGAFDRVRQRVLGHIAAQADQTAQATYTPLGWTPPAPAQPAQPQPAVTPPVAPVATTPAPAAAQPAAQPQVPAANARRLGINQALAGLASLVIIGLLVTAIVLLATRDDNGSNNSAPASGGQPTTQAASPTATATSSTAVPSNTPSGQTPNTGTTGNGCTNSPNIPCVVAQGQKNGFEPFKVDDQVVGGPADQWWPLQRADGTMVPNSFKMVGMRQSDRGLPGYEMHVPAGMILDIWLDNGGLTNRKTAARVYGPADIKAEWKVAEATLYSRPVDFVDGLKGKWARLSDTYQCGDFVAVGTLPPVIVSAHDCHQATADGKSTPQTGNTTAMDIRAIEKAFPALTGRLSVLEDGNAIKLSPGECVSLDLLDGIKADIWDGSTLTHPVGPTHVAKACEGTIRAAG